MFDSHVLLTLPIHSCSVVYDPEHADEDAASVAASAIRDAGGGRVDLLVNAAGMLHDSTAGNMPEKALRMVCSSMPHHIVLVRLAAWSLTSQLP